MSTTIGLLHPGDMGAAVGAAARAGGARVVWASEGRGDETRARARAAGLEDLSTLAAVVAASDVILSVCPPHAAADGVRGVFVDANAVSPATARAIAGVVEGGGATFVDGGIIGLPPTTRGSTRLYLSGKHAARVAALFAGGALEAIVLEGGHQAASAVKMAYAAWTKGSAALLMSVRALAAAEGVEAALIAEWRRSIPDLPRRSDDAARGSARKAWRWIGEMAEIAASFEAAGLPGGFHRAAAEVYRRLAPYRTAPEAPPPSEVVETLLRRP